MGTTDDVYNIQNNYYTYTLQQKNYFDSKTIRFTGVISPYNASPFMHISMKIIYILGTGQKPPIMK
jgi:hypothetical protein